MRMQKKYRELSQRLLLTGALFLFDSILGCGKIAFNAVPGNQKQASPGYYSVPPKVDILMLVSDNGSMIESYGAIQSQLPIFLNSLDTQKWDYHFASNSLTTARTQIPQVIGSVYDSNHQNWTAPYPGALVNGLGTVVAQFFQTPSTYSDFVTSSSLSNRNGRYEPGFDTLQKTLSTAALGTGFLRSDSLLVVMVLGNGDDTSKENFCFRTDGLQVPCESVQAPVCSTSATDPTGGSTTCSSEVSSFNYFKNYLSGLRAPNTIQFHAAVNVTGANPCLNGTTYQGLRYMRMAKALNGGQYDICSQPISQVLTSLGSSLQAQKLAYQTRYLILSQQPTVSSIVITKYSGGNSSQAQVIPANDPINGWTYAGYITNTPVIDVPVLMNQETGYAVALHGTGKLVGDDTASIQFVPVGTQTVISQ